MPPTSANAVAAIDHPRARYFGVGVVVLILAFAGVLVPLFRYAFSNELHSHIVLVPFIVGYLICTMRIGVPVHHRAGVGGRMPSNPHPVWGDVHSVPASPLGMVACALVGLGALVAAMRWKSVLSLNDYYSVMAVAFVALLASSGFAILGSRWMKAVAFPFAFLLFLAPLPDAAVYHFENWLMRVSADVSAVMFELSGTPLYRDGQYLMLPGIDLEVARECSGIRSTWVLLITSLLASHLFLQSAWRRSLLVLAVIPLGILRNGFRVLVIGLLCVHEGPHMIDSVVHKKGGPFFFALSLIPLFLLAWWLRKSEQKKSSP